MLGQDRDRDQAACRPRDQSETEHLVYRDETEQQVPKSRFARFGSKCSGNLGSLVAVAHALSLYASVCYNFSPAQLLFVSFGNYVRLFVNNVCNAVQIFDVHAQPSQFPTLHCILSDNHALESCAISCPVTPVHTVWQWWPTAGAVQTLN